MRFGACGVDVGSADLSYEGAAAPADAGVMIQSAGASIDNSGTLSGAGYGIVTQLYYNDETGQAEIRAVGTAVTNSGTIRGDATDAVQNGRPSGRERVCEYWAFTVAAG